MNPPAIDRSPKNIWNPDTDDFTVNYATDDGPSIPYTVRAQEIGEFPAYIAIHIAKHLAQHLVLKRGVKTNYQDEYEAALKEVEVRL